MTDKVRVTSTGLPELRRALQAVAPELDKQLAIKLLGVAARIVPQAQSAMPHKSGHAAGTLAPKLILRGAQITAGTGDRDDYVPWLIFGGSVGRGHRQTAAGKGIGGGGIYREWWGRGGAGSGMGRYIWPAIKTAFPQTVKALDAAIAEAATAAGFETSGHV